MEYPEYPGATAAPVSFLFFSVFRVFTQFIYGCIYSGSAKCENSCAHCTSHSAQRRQKVTNLQAFLSNASLRFVINAVNFNSWVAIMQMSGGLGELLIKP